MRVTRVLLLPALIVAVGARAQDISGKVVDKLYNPVPQASVCVKGSATQCALTGADGAFRLTPGSSALSAAFKALGFSLERSRGGFALVSPRAVRVTLEWRDLQGRRLAPARRLDLLAGPNPIALPSALPAASLAFLQVGGSGFSATWKGIWRDRAADAASHAAVPSGPSSLPALAKSGAAPVLEATKAGFGIRTYAPDNDVETGVQIMLPAEGEVALFDGKTLDGWKGNMATWSLKAAAIHGKGSGGQQFITDGDYGNFRLFIRFRNISGASHLGILFWGKRQFGYQRSDATCVMPHDGGQWDYHSAGGGGGGHQSPPEKAKTIVQTEWHYTELLANRDARTFQMATNGIWMINHKYFLSTLNGPIGLQLHDGTVEFEAKDIFIEANPKEPGKLLTLK